MLDEKKLSSEAVRKPEPATKGKTWVLKLILILIVIGLILYLFMHPEAVLNPVNEFFNNLLK